METYLAALLIFAVSMVFLSLGTLISGRQIKGHCGEAALDESCIQDSHGRKIISCGSCSCGPEDD